MQEFASHFGFCLRAGILASSLLWTSPLRANTPLVLDDAQGAQALGVHMDILSDPHGQWSLEEVRSSPLSERFVPGESDYPFVGREPVVWVRCTLQNDSRATRDWVLQVEGVLLSFERIDLFRPPPEGDGAWQVKSTGDQFSFNDQEIKNRFFAFRIPLEPGAAETIYLRFVAPREVLLPLKIWSEKALSLNNS